MFLLKVICLNRHFSAGGRFACAIFCFFCFFYMASSSALPSVLQRVVAAQSNWHCGPDEDGCTDTGCLCIPVNPDKNRHYCLDLDDLDQPCKPQTAPQQQHDQCAAGQIVMPTQQACLNEYFSGGHCLADDPKTTCNMQCNIYGGQCEPKRVPRAVAIR